MYNYNMKKEIIKNVVYIGIILAIAIVSTYYIYDKFQVNRNIDTNSEVLDVTYHETTGNKVSIQKVTPVTDAVGLSSKSYNITIKNNLTEKTNYKIRVIDDLEKIIEDECEENLITKEDIRISIKEGNKSNKIYNLVDLDDGILFEGKVNALEQKELAIRLWVNQNSSLPLGSKMHYHGIIQIVEDKDVLVVNE